MDHVPIFFIHISQNSSHIELFICKIWIIALPFSHFSRHTVKTNQHHVTLTNKSSPIWLSPSFESNSNRGKIRETMWPLTYDKTIHIKNTCLLLCVIPKFPLPHYQLQLTIFFNHVLVVDKGKKTRHFVHCSLFYSSIFPTFSLTRLPNQVDYI